MPFVHDTTVSLRSAVRLANSLEDPQALTTPEALETFVREEGHTGRLLGTQEELRQVCDIRERLRALLVAERDDAVVIVNDILASLDATPRLVRHGDLDWHVHAIDDDRPLVERILVETAMAMVDVVRADEHSRLATCAAPDCSGVVLDLSRNRSRRFCSPACGNREAVAAYRARRRSDEPQ